MNTLDFKVTFLGQSVLKYEVLLDVYDTLNQIYETKYPTLPRANKQLVGKIEKEHSLFYGGEDSKKMTKHNLLPQNVLQWFENMFQICKKNWIYNFYLLISRPPSNTKKVQLQ